MYCQDLNTDQNTYFYFLFSFNEYFLAFWQRLIDSFKNYIKYTNHNLDTKHWQPDVRYYANEIISKRAFN